MQKTFPRRMQQRVSSKQLLRTVCCSRVMAMLTMVHHETFTQGWACMSTCCWRRCWALSLFGSSMLESLTNRTFPPRRLPPGSR